MGLRSHRILVHVKLGSPVIFAQERPGKNERIFKLYKFRTMTDERDENGELLPDEVRLTKFGKTLRSTQSRRAPRVVQYVEGRYEPYRAASPFGEVFATL